MIPLLSIIAFLLFCLVVIQLAFLFSNEKALIIGKVFGVVFAIAFMVALLFIMWGTYLIESEGLGTTIVLSILFIAAIIGLFIFIILEQESHWENSVTFVAIIILFVFGIIAVFGLYAFMRG